MILVVLVALAIPAVVLTISTRASKRKLAEEDAEPRQLRQWSGPPPPEPDPDDPTAAWRETPGPPLVPPAEAADSAVSESAPPAVESTDGPPTPTPDEDRP